MKRFKLILLLLVAFILGALTIMLLPPSISEEVPKITTPKELSPGLQSCISEWEKKEQTKSSSGGIIVQFQDDVSEEEALGVINSTGLELLKSYYPSIKTFHVKVAEDKAFEWVCRLQENPKVKYTNPNRVVPAT